MHTSRTKIYPVTPLADGRLRFITRACEDLGVTYSHLRKVMTGERVSASLLARVRDLHPELIELFKGRANVAK